MNTALILQKLADPDFQVWLFGCLSAVLYLTGRITKQQFIAEQMKAKGVIAKDEAKEQAVSGVAKPITTIIGLLNYLPLVGTKLPVLNKSVPDVINTIIETPIGLLGDILHNLPVVGTNINNKQQ